jgi:hypothetical protein
MQIFEPVTDSDFLEQAAHIDTIDFFRKDFEKAVIIAIDIT